MAKKILVVDDEPDIVTMVASRLEALGYEIVSASDGKDALEKARTTKPDLVVLDLMLPKLNGYEVCHSLGTDPQHRDTPVVMLTASGQVDDIKKGMECGAVAYITKPFKPDVLLGVVQGILGPA
jgi:DNA-binding response OmpR family regulator